MTLTELKILMNKIFSENYVATISILWIVLMACLVILKRHTLTTLDLNSIGDFLAGAFAPLGFFWLVACFYQQGKGLEQNSIALNLQANELQASTEALQLQVQEMKASVQQQKEISSFHKLELQERLYKARAKLEISSLYVTDKMTLSADELEPYEKLEPGEQFYTRPCKVSFRLLNSGANVHNVKIEIKHPCATENLVFPILEYKQKIDLEYELLSDQYDILMSENICLQVIIR